MVTYDGKLKNVPINEVERKYSEVRREINEMVGIME